jgi:hypothetical protein
MMMTGWWESSAIADPESPRGEYASPAGRLQSAARPVKFD